MDILILEDSEERQKQFKQNLIGHYIVICDIVKATIENLKYKKWNVLFLDHDLGLQSNVLSGEGTGWEVAKFLSERPDLKPELVVLHSLNFPGRRNMKALIPDAIELPFAWGESNLKKLGLTDFPNLD